MVPGPGPKGPGPWALVPRAPRGLGAQVAPGQSRPRGPRGPGAQVAPVQRSPKGPKGPRGPRGARIRARILPIRAQGAQGGPRAPQAVDVESRPPYLPQSVGPSRPAISSRRVDNCSQSLPRALGSLWDASRTPKPLKKSKNHGFSGFRGSGGLGPLFPLLALKGCGKSLIT